MDLNRPSTSSNHARIGDGGTPEKKKRDELNNSTRIVDKVDEKVRKMILISLEHSVYSYSYQNENFFRTMKARLSWINSLLHKTTQL